jgi:hypothetical protein
MMKVNLLVNFHPSEGNENLQFQYKVLSAIKEVWNCKTHDIMHMFKPVEMHDTKHDPDCKMWTLAHNNGSTLVH